MSAPRAASALAAVAALAGCSGVFRSHEPAPVVYSLAARPAPTATATPLEATLVIARPAARPGLDGDHIAVRLPGQRLDAYAGGRWSGPLPRVVEGLLVDSFRGAGAWRAVVTERSAFPGRYLLQSEIVEFAADYADGGAPLARVVLRAELGIGPERRLVADVEGRGEVRATADRQREVAAAFESAAAAAIQQVVAAADAAALAAEAARPAR